MGLNLEFTAMDESMQKRRINEALQTGIDAQRCPLEPAALCYISLN